jgi:hypothetical protein
MTGGLYQTFVPVIPSSTALILGGEGLDLDLDVSVSRNKIYATGAATTSRGSAYPFAVRGSTDAPVFELPEKLASVATRMSGGMGRFVNSTLRSGKEVLEGALDTAASLGKSAIQATGSFFKGVGKMAKEWFNNDQGSSDTGLREVISETGGHLLDAFSESGEAISKAHDRTSEALQTDSRFQAWIEQISARHDVRAATALKEVFQAPFPPVIHDLERKAR